jgi:DNA-directed RNA polymerase specialized sigma24 family protein
MRVSDSSVQGGTGQFHTTRWTLVLASARDQSQTGRAALAALCQIYWYPLYAFARRRGYSPPDAQDLTQGFFLHILEHRALSGVDRLKGKFRSFLLACFQNHLSAETHRAHRLKRGGQCQFISLRAFVGITETKPEGSYEQAAKALGIAVGTVKTFIHRLRKRYLAVVREEVARTVSDPAEIEGEIRALCDALTAAAGRLKP